MKGYKARNINDAFISATDIIQYTVGISHCTDETWWEFNNIYMYSLKKNMI